MSNLMRCDLDPAYASIHTKDVLVSFDSLPSLEIALKHLADAPGVYQFFDGEGRLLYVGKAKRLKARVRSYFQKGSQLTGRISAMVHQVARLHTIVTDSEAEAFLLESNLIKTHGPKYNILLRDDKRYPWIALSDEPYPRLFVTRNPKKLARTKTRFFGPYPNSGDMYTLLATIRKVFPLRQRRRPLFKDRPCMNFFIGLCPGPCQQKITPEGYQHTIDQVVLLLKGKTDDLLEELSVEMQAASEAMAFERAAQLRDTHSAIYHLAGEQKVISPDPTLSQDAVGMATNGHRVAVTILSIRRGKLIRSQSLPYTIVDTIASEAGRAAADSALAQEAYSELLTQLLGQWEYLSVDLPDELLLPLSVMDLSLVAEALTARRQRLQPGSRRVSVSVPQRGEKKALIDMATRNAEQSLTLWLQQDAEKLGRDPSEALVQLQEVLDLPDYPRRMECYDISHFQGSHTVASMVVFEEGRAAKDQYRRFKIQIAEGKPDDFANMAEVIRRRFSSKAWDAPDLVIIDGGKGQLSAACEALEQVRDLGGGPPPAMISLAKRFEEVYVPDQSHPIILPPESPARLLLQQIRDEAHRFAITFHRSLRAKKATLSVLDTLPGLGKARKAKLLERFKTL
ncbi:MAG: excinuclease ABC subunit UvrC, partial [Vampirovibrionales bacterium]|nr:excinuclease ABC subunit UvrC [Vampirovibrionales bacterium]